MTTRDTEAMRRKLSTALKQASLTTRAEGDRRGLAGAPSGFYAAEQAGAPGWLLLGADGLTGRSRARARSATLAG
jgi:hypothetical protein